MREIVNPMRLRSPLTLLRSNLSSINKWADLPHKNLPPSKEQCDQIHKSIVSYAASIVATKRERTLISSLETIKHRKKSVYREINKILLELRKYLILNVPNGLNIPFVEQIFSETVIKLRSKNSADKPLITFLNRINQYKISIAENKIQVSKIKELSKYSDILSRYKLYRKIESECDEILLIAEMLIEQLVWNPYRDIYYLLIEAGYIKCDNNFISDRKLLNKWRSRMSARIRQRKHRDREKSSENR